MLLPFQMEACVDKKVRKVCSEGVLVGARLFFRNGGSHYDFSLAFLEHEAQHIRCIGFLAVAFVERAALRWLYKHEGEREALSEDSVLQGKKGEARKAHPRVVRVTQRGASGHLRAFL
jgi:hypothetical protein